jgi:hypothetical protein
MKTYCQRYEAIKKKDDGISRAVWMEYSESGDLIAIYKEKDGSKEKPENLYTSVPLAVEIIISEYEYDYWLKRGKESPSILYYE